MRKDPFLEIIAKVHSVAPNEVIAKVHSLAPMEVIAKVQKNSFFDKQPHLPLNRGSGGTCTSPARSEAECGVTRKNAS